MAVSYLEYNMRLHLRYVGTSVIFILQNVLLQKVIQLTFVGQLFFQCTSEAACVKHSISILHYF